MEEKKICSKCSKEKKMSEFYKDKQKSSGYRPDCKSCNKINCSGWAHKNPTQRKFNVLKFSTGVTKDQYLKLLLLQNNECAICKKSIEDNNRNLSVDHDHKTYEVRGLLCTKCNFGLGYFNDNKQLLKFAIYYLDNNLIKENIKYKQNVK
jgi:hypothetical protein